MRLGTAIHRYSAARQASGAIFEKEGYILRAFARTAGDRTSVSKISPDEVRKFLSSHGSGTRYWNSKYHVLSGFWTFAIQRGYTSMSPLPAHSMKDPRLFTPYIYTRDELKRLLSGISTYQKKFYRLEPVTFRAILLLLYGAGLRIGEALRLSCSDVDFSDATLMIRCSKFHKTRRIALSPHLRKVLHEYDENRQQEGHKRESNSPFFTYDGGERIGRNIFEKRFLRLRHHVGIGPTKGRRQPRLHDLRHTFAVHRVIAWYRSGLDVQHLLPGLSTHLGHLDLSSTQVYLTTTPELLVEASLRFENYAAEVAHG